LARTFQLTAALNLQAPKNLRPIVNSIRQQLKTVTMDVNVKISPRSVATIKQLNAELKTLKATVQQVSQSAAGLNAVATSLNSVNASLNKTTRTARGQAAGMKTVTEETKKAATQMEIFGAQSALAIKRFAAFSVGTAGVIGLGVAIRNGLKEAVAFDKEMVKLSQVTGKTLKGLKDVSGEITRLATTFGVSSSSLLEVASTLSQAGLSAKETKTALEALAKSALAPSFDNMAQTTEGAIAVMRQFNLQAKDMEGALGSINAVSAAFAVESQDLIAAVRIAGSVFASASKGVVEGKDALNQFISIITSVRQTTRESAESIATGLRTIFTRIQRPRTIEFLKEFGVNLQDVEGKFVGPYEAVKRLSEGLKDLNTRDTRFAQIAEELGGYRQLSKVLPLLQQFTVAQQAYQVAQSGSNSLSKDAIIAQQSLANQYTKTQERFLALMRSLAGSEAFRNLATIALKTADAFIKMAEAIEPVIPYLAILGSIKALSGGIQFGRGFIGGIRNGGGATSVGNNLGELVTGGKRKGFNRGGLVPGSGRGDTVPAALEPGEFVLRKDAVQAIGTDKLHKFNRFAVGGLSNKKAAAALSLSDTEFLTRYSGTAKSGQQSPRDYLKSVLANSIAAGDEILPVKSGALPSPQGAITSSVVNPQKNRFAYGKNNPPTAEDHIARGPYGGLFFRLGSDKVSTSLVSTNKSSLSAAGQAKFGKKGRVFGQPLQFYINKEKGDQFDNLSEQIFDKNIREVIEAGGGLADLSKAVKMNPATVIDTVKDQVGFETFAGGIFEAFIAAISKQINPARGRNFDFMPVQAPIFEELFGEGIRGVKYADAKLTSDAKSRSSLVQKAVNAQLAGASDISVSPFGGTDKEYDSFNAQAKEIISKAGTNIRRKKYARGGNVDTIPAMLTPGEFVINKKAASAIGHSTLMKMNQADKIKGYAKGGVVGDTAGVSVLPAGTKPTDVLSNHALDIIYKKFDRLGVPIEETADRLEDVIRHMRDFNSNVEDAAASVAGFEGQVDRAINQTGPDTVMGNRDAKKVRDKQFRAQIASGEGITTSGYAVTVGNEGPIAPSKGLFGRIGGGIRNTFAPGGKLGDSKFGGAIRGIGGGIKNNLAGVAGVGGFAAASFAQSAIGNSTPTRAGIGGGISGALAGAATGGLVAGAPGAVVGGLVGAIEGYTSAVKDAKLQQAMDKLTKSTNELDGTFKKFQNGKASLSDVNKDVGDVNKDADAISGLEGKKIRDVFGGGFGGAFSASTNRIGRAFGLEGSNTTFNGQLAQYQQQVASTELSNRRGAGDTARDAFAQEFAQGKFNKILSKSAAGGEALSLTDFGKKNKDLINALAISGPNADKNSRRLAAVAPGAEREALRERLGAIEYQDLFKASKGLFELTQNSAKARIAVELFSQSIEQMGANLARVGADAAGRQNEIGRTVGNITGSTDIVGQASKADVFANPLAYSNREISGQIQNAGALAGVRPDITNKLGNTITGSNTLQKELPKYLLDLYKNEGQNQGTTSLPQAIESFIGSKAPNLPEELKQQIIQGASAETGKERNAGSQDIEAYIRGQLTGDLKQISDATTKAALDLQKGLEEANSVYIQGINQYTQLRLQNEQRAAEFAGNKAGRATAQKAAEGKTLTPADQGAAEEARIRALAGTTSVGKISGNIDALASRRAAIESRLSVINEGVDTRKTPEYQAQEAKALQSEQQSLIKELADNKKATSKSTEALGLVANATGRLAGLQEKLAQLENRRAAGGNYAKALLTASPQERVKLAYEKSAFEKLRSGGFKDGELKNNPKLVEAIIAGQAFQRQGLDPEQQRASDRELDAGLIKAGGLKYGGKGPVAEAIRAASSAQDSPEEKKNKEIQASIRESQNRAEEKLIQVMGTELPALLTKLDENLKATVSGLGAAVNNAFPISEFGLAVNDFGKSVQEFAAIPKHITHEMAPMTLNIVGGENLAGLEPLINKAIEKQISKLVPLQQRIENA